MIACKPQKFPVRLWIVTLTEPGDTKPIKNWDRLKFFSIQNFEKMLSHRLRMVVFAEKEGFTVNV